MEDVTDILKVIGGAITGAVALLGGQKVRAKPVDSPEVEILRDMLKDQRAMYADQREYYGRQEERQDGHHTAVLKLLDDGHEERLRLERKIEKLSA